MKRRNRQATLHYDTTYFKQVAAAGSGAGAQARGKSNPATAAAAARGHGNGNGHPVGNGQGQGPATLAGVTPDSVMPKPHPPSQISYNLDADRAVIENNTQMHPQPEPTTPKAPVLSYNLDADPGDDNRAVIENNAALNTPGMEAIRCPTYLQCHRYLRLGGNRLHVSTP